MYGLRHFSRYIFTFYNPGVVFTCSVVQTCVWAVLDAVFLFWAIVAPFSYQQFKLSGKIRIAHIISVLLGLLVPLPAALLPLEDGYTQYFSVVFYCLPLNINYTYYTLLLPLSIFAGITTFVQIYTTWTIFKVAIIIVTVTGRKRILLLQVAWAIANSISYL